MSSPPPGEGGWTLWNIQSGSSIAEAQSVAGFCDRYSTLAGGQTVAAINTVSPDGQYVAASSSGAAGYHSATTVGDTFIDASGSNSGGFAGTTAVQDSQVLFNPKTGDLWWERDGHLFSNSLPPTTPVDHGPGFLYAFTPTGEPMPIAYYDSPSGKERGVLGINTLAGFNDPEFNFGPSSSMTPQCLEHADPAGSGIAGTACGSVRSSAIVSHCVSNENGGPYLAGWVDDSTVVCGWRGAADVSATLAAFTIDGSGRITKRRSLIPKTSKSVIDALVTPDGKSVLFITDDAQSGYQLYETQTDGSGTQPRLVSPVSADTDPALIGWVLPNRTIEP